MQILPGTRAWRIIAWSARLEPNSIKSTTAFDGQNVLLARRGTVVRGQGQCFSHLILCSSRLSSRCAR